MSKNKFAVFDIDGTLFRYSLYLELVKELINEGAFSESDANKILEAFEQWRLDRTDKALWDYVELALAVHENNLPNISFDLYERTVQKVFEQNKDYVNLYPKQLIKKLKAKGYLIFAISGSQIETIQKFCDYHGFDDYIGSVHKRDEATQKFTNEINHTHRDKVQQIKSLAAKHNASFVDSIGVGDSHGDITMLNLVDNPIAFNPSPPLYEHAKKSKWDIVIERKSVIYQLRYIRGIYQLDLE